ncbi:MAG: MoaD/ThiS family protein [Thermoplasmata archaeon]
MRLKILYFGIFRDITGKYSEIIDFEGKYLVDLKEYIKKKYPEIADDNMIISINFRYIENNPELNENDEIAIMSPVNGG